MHHITPTFNFITPTKTFNNLDFQNLLIKTSEYFATFGDCDTTIICNITGQIINNAKYFHTNSNNNYTFFDLLEITPYFKRISPIKYCPFGINDPNTFVVVK